MTRPTPRTTSSRLPEQARARLARSADATTHTSFLSVPAAYGVRAAGFEAVGDVMGCIATQTSFAYLGRCGATSPTSAPRVVHPSSSGSQVTSFVRQLAGAYRTALDRLRAEAVALGADGVLGIELQLARYEDLREVVALGTAVRSTGRVRPKRPFTTDLSGSDVVKLMAGGWTPVELHVAVQLGLRHIDRQTVYEANPLRSGPRGSNTNREVSGYTELRQQLTLRVREQWRTQVARSGADGALLSDLRNDEWHRACMSVGSSSDLVGLATATGTSVARFAVPSSTPPRPLTILPLGRATT